MTELPAVPDVTNALVLAEAPPAIVSVIPSTVTRKLKGTHVCDECGLDYATTFNLKRHMKSHRTSQDEKENINIKSLSRCVKEIAKFSVFVDSDTNVYVKQTKV